MTHSKDSVPVAGIVADPKASYSRGWIKDAAWGRVWSDAESLGDFRYANLTCRNSRFVVRPGAHMLDHTNRA